MTIREVQRDSHTSIGHVVLALITEMTRVSGWDDLYREVTAMDGPLFDRLPECSVRLWK